MSSAKKQKTLFSFFNKKDTPPKQNGTPGKALSTKQDGASPDLGKKNTKSPQGEDVSQWEQGDMVWAKLEGYPWWPSLVCAHPTQKKHIKTGNKAAVHVQFFDDPTSRSWVKAKFVKPYQGSDHKDFQVRGGQFYTSDPQCRDGAVQADQAMKLSREERLNLVLNLLSTDDESDMEPMDAEPIKYDSDIFDAGGESDDEQNNSKENHPEAENEKEKTPKKTPKKGSRASSRPQAKRRKILEVDSGPEDSEDEFKPKDDEESSEDESSGEDEDIVSEPETESEAGTPIKGKKRKMVSTKKNQEKSPEGVIRKGAVRGHKAKNTLSSFSNNRVSDDENDIPSTPKTPLVKTPSVSNKTISKLTSFSAPDSPSTPVATEEGRVFTHLSYEWLKPDKLKDLKGRGRDNPEYDPKTLKIPDSALNQMTPAMRQWWVLKSKHFDTVLFFKMGKFYELFHMDAVTAVNELGVIYMKGDYAHAGFPEIAFGRYSETLVQKGYKIARIEQTESVDQMNERVRQTHKATKFDKVVRRELCRKTTKGTKVYSFIDGDASSSQHAYLTAICEQDGGDSKGSTYGVCFVDTSIGKFHIGQFEDDRHCSRLRTLFSHYPPVQVLIEKGHLSAKTQVIINNNLVSALRDELRTKTEFWESSKTLEVLMEEDYFVDEKNKESGCKLPDIFKKLVSPDDSLGRTPAEGYELAVRSLGALTWYMKDSCIDQELLSMCNFEEYIPLDVVSTQEKLKEVPAFATGRQHMVLDGVTLFNLDIIQNSSTGTVEGTLLDRLDQCATPFGKRSFKQWLCAPLCNPDTINDRLNAMEDLMECQDVVAEVTELLKKLPDLERLLSKIHTLGSASRSKNHPDSRAVMFEEVAYSKRKIEDFLAALDGFRTSIKIINKFQDVAGTFKSKLLAQTVTQRSEDEETEGGRFPNLKEQLDFFQEAFDHKKAKQDGTIKPSKGVDPEYDRAMNDIKSTHEALDDYLTKQRKLLHCNSIVYWGTGKNRFQLEIPERVAKDVPDEYDVTSQKKGFKRYWTKEIEGLLADMVSAEDHRDAALKDCMRRIFHKFDASYKKWNDAIQCLSVVDVLICLAEYSRCGDGVMCRPQLVMPGENQPTFLEIREGRHPCISRTFAGGDFIPNDTIIGIKDENDVEEDAETSATSQVVLVTGPNMGGKSTLMRQVGVIVIMAQMGCYVPAEVCRLTPVDRVFTRLGASDRIMAGESTFFVELSETSSILQHATKHSLVLLDELGRGTATYDGTAIACAVVQEMSQNICCRTLFSTHYHSLVEEFSHDPNIRLGHMACMVENENDEDPSQETITFLYKFVKGACPKSYGFNAARLADLPEEVIQIALKKAKDFENMIDRLRWFKELNTTSDWKKVKQLHQAISVP